MAKLRHMIRSRQSSDITFEMSMLRHIEMAKVVWLEMAVFRE